MAIIKSSFWPRTLPPLGIALAVVLAVATLLVWWTDRSTSDDGRVGVLVALVQSARPDIRAALAGDEERFDALVGLRAELARLKGTFTDDDTTSSAARQLVADGSIWQGIDGGLEQLTGAREALDELHAARITALDLAPQLLVATSNVASALPARDLEANQPYLSRFEIAVEGMQQNLRSFGAAGMDLDGTLQRLGDSEQYFDLLLRGLRGEDSSLGLVPARNDAARAELEKAEGLFGDTRTALATVNARAGTLRSALAAADTFDGAAQALLARFRGLAPGGVASGWIAKQWPLKFVLAALAITLLMILAYYLARDFRRAAEIQAEQNERNQQAILRLLDELSSLADGDLTVQATVTEDITGAIADSINYAIEALRDLVTTINDSSILVDAASKQTENTSRHLVRSSEAQAKQAAAASEAMARMAASIEEVSGNAERSADVARHAVEIAHKGGEAVRRTIAGMNTIRETIQDTSKRIKRLGESSQEIGNIVELIEEIAEQTNILALNASIEASRAGESSRGFAVVADEVQKLAERSTNATKKIEVLVSTIQSDTNEAVTSMERSTTDVVGGALLAENAGAALDEIEQVSHQIASLVQNISSSSKEQASVSSGITKNMHVLREISRKATESTAAASAAISKLSELASQLRKTVAGFALPDQSGATGVLSPERVAASLERAEQLAAPVGSTAERRRQSG